MKGNRDMFYSNFQSGGYGNANMLPIQPQGYQMSTEYQAYGPNVMPNMNNGGLNYNQSYNTGNTYIDEYDQRLTKIERQIRRLDQRLRKLENNGISEEDITIDSNMYMI